MGRANIVDFLLERDADVNCTDDSGFFFYWLEKFSYLYKNLGWTPLISASSAGHLDVVKLLLGKNALIDAVNSHNR